MKIALPVLIVLLLLVLSLFAVSTAIQSSLAAGESNGATTGPIAIVTPSSTATSGANFPAADTFVVSGHIADPANNPLANVTVTFSKNFQGTITTSNTITDASGNYSSGDVGCQNNVLVTPSKAGFGAFTPVSRSFISGSCLTGTATADFTGIPPCSVPSFGPASILPVGRARSLAVEDFNNDGRLDIVAPNNSVGSGVRVVLNTGNGGFTISNFNVGRNPISVATADFNNDGKMDVIVGNGVRQPAHASLILGTGTGSFGAPININWGFPNEVSSSSTVAVADFNSDGKTDIVVGVEAQLNGRILTALGDGTGNFTNFQNIFAASAPAMIVAADLNGDNKPDLATANSNSNAISVLIGDGTGQFGAATNFNVGTFPRFLAAADLNGDGKVDLATANQLSSNVSVLINNGSGSFAPAVNYSSGGEDTVAVTAADFDGDGDNDLAVVNRSPRNILLLQNQGNGTFIAKAAFLGGASIPDAITTGDFNGDGRPDLATAHEILQRVTVMLNNCDTPAAPSVALSEPAYFFPEDPNLIKQFFVIRTGSLAGAASVQYATSDGTATSPADYTAASGTLNFADGEASKKVFLDVVDDILDEGDDESFQITLSNASGAATLGSPSTAPTTIFDNDPTPQITISDVFAPEGNSSTSNAGFSVTLSNPSGRTVSVDFATANGAATAGSDYVSSNGTVTFSPGEVSKTINVAVVGDTTGEINENFFVNLSNPTNATLALAQGLGTILDDDSACPAPAFQVTSNLPITTPIDAVAADFNGDNKKDLIVASFNSMVELFLSDGNGGFSGPTIFAVGANVQSLAVGDFNGDLKLDVVTVNENTKSILLGNGSGGFAAATTTPAPDARSVVVGDLNADGKQDLALVNTAVTSSGSVSILLGDGSGAFGAPTTYPTGTSSLFGALANINGDNKLDLVVANLNSFNVSILLNNGDGTFGAATNIALGYNVQSVVTGDLNNDSKTDIVALGSQPQGRMSILLGNGDGTFGAPTTSVINPPPYRGALADLNGDGQLDLATANPIAGDAGSLVVHFGNGTGALSAPAKYTVGISPLAVAIADFNGDTKPDIALPVPNSARVSILLNTCAATPITTVQFSSSNYFVNEATNSVSVTVTRNGDTSGTSTVDYTTTDTDNFTVNCTTTEGHAFGRCDFATSVDTLTFGPGETSKSFLIPIINDVWSEGSETFGVTLSNATGAGLGTPATAVITINDNEPVIPPLTGVLNPYFATPFFIRQHYLDFLSREPEVGEPWSGILNGCPNVNNDPSCDRLFVSQSIFGSQEFQLKGYYNYRFYKVAFNRLPLYQEIVVDMRKVTGTTQQDTFNRKAQFANDFVLRTEFANQYNALSNTQYVNTLMNRYSLSAITTSDPSNPDTGGLVTLTIQDLIDRLNGVGGTMTRAQVLRAIVDSQNVFTQEFIPGFVALQYYGYLRRFPDPGGYNSWLTYMNAHPNDFRTMVNGFMNSDEYRKRFGPNPDNP